MVGSTNPQAGATTSGTVAISVSITDSRAALGLQFKVGGTNIGSAVAVPPYTIPWDTTAASNGFNTLEAVARDEDACTAVDSISVVTSNSHTNGGVQ
jgi:hypothetical protein